MRKRTLLFVLSISICTLFLTLCIWFVLPIAIFYGAEIQADPKFDQLNQTAFAQIPPPKGATELDVYKSGGYNTPIHGRYLNAHYQMDQTTSQQVIAYYKSLLLSKGWVPYRSAAMAENYFRFVHNRSCIDLNIFEATNDYIINIWNDFWHQSFSPPSTNMDLLRQIEFWDPSSATCP